MGDDTEPTLFELSVPGRSAVQLRTTGLPERPLDELLPLEALSTEPLDIAEVSERDLVAHFTRLSHRQFSVDLGSYPFGSCTMKYNPKVCDTVAAMPGLNDVHPGAPASLTQGWLGLMVELEETLCEITGMAQATLQPAAGAAGELTGLLLMRAYHEAAGERRTRVLIPDSAHGTNPASATLGGFEVTTDPHRCARPRRSRAAQGCARHRRGRDHADEPQHGGSLRRGHRRDRRCGPRGGRPALLRRRQPQRHLGRRSPRRHGLRHHPHEPAQDLRHPSRWRRTRCGTGGGLHARRPLSCRVLERPGSRTAPSGG